MDQILIMERVIVEFVNFTDVSFIMVTSGKNTFWTAGGFFTAIIQMAIEKIWLPGWAAVLYLDRWIDTSWGKLRHQVVYMTHAYTNKSAIIKHSLNSEVSKERKYAQCKWWCNGRIGCPAFIIHSWCAYITDGQNFCLLRYLSYNLIAY